MRNILFITGLILLTTLQGISQSKLVPASKSQLTGITLPAETRQDNRILSTAAAKTLMQMKAEEGGLTMMDQVEVFSIPPSNGNQVMEQIKSAVIKAGWEIQPFTSETTYSLLVNQQRTVLMYLESNKKETALYFTPTSNPPKKAESKVEAVAVVQPVQQPEQTQSQTQVQTQTQTQTQSQTQVVAPVEVKQQQTTTPDVSGFTFSTTNFDDGWISTLDREWVKVTKGNTVVQLYYAVQINDEIRSTNLLMRDYFWNQLVVPHYTIKAAYPLNESLSFTKVHFTEAEAIDPSGKPVYIALTVLVDSGIAKPVLAICSDKNAYYQLFPEPAILGNMLGYNRFAVAMKDVIGEWSENSGASVNLYNTYTGNYAGMNYSQSANTFIFNSDGTYSSKHNGAYSVYGNNTVYTQNYKGKVTVTNWDLSMTNRFKDATENYHAWFEVIPGGRILHIQNKAASGLQYNLVKVK